MRKKKEKEKRGRGGGTDKKKKQGKAFGTLQDRVPQRMLEPGPQTLISKVADVQR